jgi:hypothetical protein
LRTFYRKNCIKPELLWKEENNHISKVLINPEEDPIYLNGELKEMPQPCPE